LVFLGLQAHIDSIQKYTEREGAPVSPINMS